MFGLADSFAAFVVTDENGEAFLGHCHAYREITAGEAYSLVCRLHTPSKGKKLDEKKFHAMTLPLVQLVTTAYLTDTRLGVGWFSAPGVRAVITTERVGALLVGLAKGSLFFSLCFT
jgi:hypothetical protein